MLHHLLRRQKLKMNLNRNQFLQIVKPFCTELISSLLIECFTLIVILSNGIKVQWSGYTIFWITCFLIFITYYLFTYQIFSFLTFLDLIFLSKNTVDVVIKNEYPFRQGMMNDKNVFDKNGKVVVKEFLYYKVIANAADEDFIFTSTKHLNLEKGKKYAVTYSKYSKVIVSIEKI